MSESTTQHPPQSSPAPAPNAYLRTRVMTSSPEQLRLLLLEGAVRFTRQGRDALVVKDHEGIFNGFSRARDIVVELMTSIRPDAEADLKGKVQGLYTFIFKLLVDASFEKDVEKADKAAELLEYEVETWRLAIQKLSAERSSLVLPTNATSTATAKRPTLSLQA
jgi:flagellar protein FliS